MAGEDVRFRNCSILSKRMEQYLKDKGCPSKVIPHAADCNGVTAPPKVFNTWVPTDIAKMRYPDGVQPGMDDPMDIDVPIDMTPASYNMQQKVEEYNRQKQLEEQQKQQQQRMQQQPFFYPIPMPFNTTGPADMDWANKVPVNPSDMEYEVYYT